MKPSSRLTPKFAKDVHLDATAQWAVEVGFSIEYAQIISVACNSVDGEWWDEGLAWFISGSGNAGYYHYMTDKEDNRNRDWLLAEKIIIYRFQKSCRMVVDGNESIDAILNAFGKGLHTYQDKFSHSRSDGSPMTDAEHGRFKGTDNIEKHPEKFHAVKNASISALKLLKTILDNKKSLCLNHSSKCPEICDTWKMVISFNAPHSGLPEWD